MVNIILIKVRITKKGKCRSSWKCIHGLDISADGKSLFVSSKKDNKLFLLDIKSGKSRVLALSPAPYHLNTIKGTGVVYVSSRKKPLIWVVDQKKMKVITTIKLPAGEAHQMVTIK